MGGPLCENRIWDFDIIFETQTIWVSLVFRIRVLWYFLVFINFRGPRDFINRRGLLIQGGGDYFHNERGWKATPAST